MKHRERSLNGHSTSMGRIVGASVVIGTLVAAAGPVVASSASVAHTKSSVVVSTMKTSTYGTILVSGTTVYTLKASNVACTAKCLKIWPEVLLPKGATRAVAGHGVAGSKLGTVKRAGGRLQVTYAGSALYWFAKDTTSGQVKGNVTDTWGKWSVVVTVKASGGTPTTTTTTGGGGGIGF